MFLDPKRDIRKHRDRLPHWYQDNTLVFLTWRLADSLPKSAIAKITENRDAWLSSNPKPWKQSQAFEFNRRFILPLEEKLDAGLGDCVLRQPEIRAIVTNAFHQFDKERYHLDSYIIMPNHVHVLLILNPNHPLEAIVQSLKSFTSKAINQKLKRRGKLWQRSYWDRLIRSEKHLKWTRDYIARNPGNLRSSEYTKYEA